MRGRRALGPLLAGVLAGAALVVPVTTADAAPPTAAACAASDADIYRPPASVTGIPGSVIACKATELPHVPGSVPLHAWKVQYSSKDNAGAPVAVSGTVVVPDAAWKGTGSRPAVAFNPGTLGLGPQCAFSKQLSGAFQDEYEGDNIAALLKAGYAVAATDGAGYLDGQTHPYVSGVDAGHALLDVVRAASAVPGSGVAKSAPVGLWGYSEGGAASLWAAQLASSYAPELKVVGDASGGVPGDLKVVAQGLDGGAFAGFLADAVIGLAASHPAMPFDELLDSTGRSAVAKAKSLCLVGTIATFAGQKLENYTEQRLSLDQIYALTGTDGKTWGQVVHEQKLGTGIGRKNSGARYEIGFPVLQYRGMLEEVIPTSTEDATRRAYCNAGITTQWKLYPGDHLLTDQQAKDDVVKWLGDRFAGRPELGSCLLP
ncbi:lipase family protein [Streptomyces kunmingensis]|uniref:Lipase family protein n=1 Tax=Streptomyces kunmingensis TaxID=68225 RepID=A0ABU6C2D8_9ACTN|nr:lipase family protein [Streptomyces kunmingensis]MEB3958853.1 lipase family protein [Streptomyces kunmingensis]